MSFWESAGGASVISAGADILGGAFGRGNSIGRQASAVRRLGRNQLQVDMERARYMPSQIVQGAKDAGIHPLVAMGAGGALGGSTPVPAQPETGGWRSDAMRAVSRHYQRMAEIRAQTDLIDKQAEASRARALETSAAGHAITGEDLSPRELATLGRQGYLVVQGDRTRNSAGLVTLEPDKQRTRSAEDSSRSAATNPAWMSVEIWPGWTVDVLWSEEGPAEAMDSLGPVLATIARNAGIGYKKLYDYASREVEASWRRKRGLSTRADPKSRRIHDTEYKRRKYYRKNFNVRKYLRRGIAG